MSFEPKDPFNQRRPRSRQQAIARYGKVTPLTASRKRLPVWLRLLKRLERTSTLTTFLLGIGVLAIYSFTVYLQQRWSDAYADLQSLHRKERGLTAAIASLKEQLAKDAENPNAGLVPQRPNNTIHLKASPQSSSATSQATSAEASSEKTSPSFEGGY